MLWEAVHWLQSRASGECCGWMMGSSTMGTLPVSMYECPSCQGQRPSDAHDMLCCNVTMLQAALLRPGYLAAYLHQCTIVMAGHGGAGASAQ